MSRIVTVFGATGTQGSAVLDAIIADGTFVPRAVTRNTSSEAAVKLKSRGAEVVQADLWDVESLKKAITGSEGVFGVTNFFDPSIYPANPKGEIEQGKNLIAASKAVGVKFLIFSSLPPSSKISNGKYSNIPFFDSKAAIEELLKESDLPHAILRTAWFAENLWTLGSLVKMPEGSLEIQIPKFSPTAPQAVTWVERDLGPSVVALFKNYETKKDLWNQTYYAVEAQVSYTELAEIIQKAIGKPVSFSAPPTTGMAELDEMLAFQSEFGMYLDSTIPDPRLIALGVKFGTMQEFAETAVKPRFA